MRRIVFLFVCALVITAVLASYSNKAMAATSPLASPIGDGPVAVFGAPEPARPAGPMMVLSDERPAGCIVYPDGGKLCFLED